MTETHEAERQPAVTGPAVTGDGVKRDPMQADTPKLTPAQRRGLVRRVFLPMETKQGVIRTSDGSLYLRMRDGSIRRAHPKVRGKAARRAEREARRLARGDR